MTIIRPSDYYSLSYDAAAQNTVDELFGNNHKRVLAEQSITLAVTELKTVRTKASFVPGTWQQSFLRSNYDYKLKNGSTYSHTVLSTTTTRTADTTQYTVLADYEVVFTQLNLPEEATLSVEIQPEIISKHTHYHAASSGSNNDSAMLGYLDSDGYAAESGFYNCESNDKFCLTSGTRWDATYGENVNVSQASSKKLTYVDLGVPTFLNTDVTPTSLYEGIEEDAMEKVWSAATMSGTWFRRSIQNLYSMTTEKLDRDTVRVTGRMPVATMHETTTATLSVSSSSASSDNSKSLYMGVLEKLNVKLTYLQMAWNSTSFDYLAEGSQKRYPYKFSNERLANTKDKVGNRLWSDYYPQLIFGKYSGGRYYVQLKVRAKFMLVNDLHIDSEVQIYDLKGKLISRNSQPCIFRIKRIIKTYDNSEFTYIINCLEE